jgi:hypothetical protein
MISPSISVPIPTFPSDQPQDKADPSRHGARSAPHATLLTRIENAPKPAASLDDDESDEDLMASFLELSDDSHADTSAQVRAQRQPAQDDDWTIVGEDIPDSMFHDAEERPEDFVLVDYSTKGTGAAPTPATATPTSWTGGLTNGLFSVATGLKNAAGDVTAYFIGTTATPVIPSRPLADQSKERIKALEMEIQLGYARLNQCLHNIDGTTPYPADANLIHQEDLTLMEKLGTLTSTGRGALTAVLNASGGVATTVAVSAGVANTVGFLLPGVGIAAVAGGFALTLKKLRETPSDIVPKAAKIEVAKHLAPLDAKQTLLTALVERELHREQMAERIKANLSVGMAKCDILLQAITEAENAIKEEPVAVKDTSAETQAQSSLLTRLADAREALVSLIGSLSKQLSAITEWVFPTPPMRAAKAFDAAEQRAEESFRNDSPLMLKYLADVQDSNISGQALTSAFRELKNGGASKIKSDDLKKDIHIGENLVRTLASSPVSFGAVEFTAWAGTLNTHYAVPSNLTTARSIAHFIEAQATTNAQAGLTEENASISRRDDGTYVVADPDRKIYNFLANAPTAYASYLSESAKERFANPLATGIGNMAILDYSGTLPGGANKMTFETQIDDYNQSILVMRFVKEDQTSSFRPNHAAVKDFLDEMRAHNPAPLERANFSSMSDDDKHKYFWSLVSAQEKLADFLQVEAGQLTTLQDWANPVFTDRVKPQA